MAPAMKTADPEFMRTLRELYGAPWNTTGPARPQ
jgi:hypothetical protein